MLLPPSKRQQAACQQTDRGNDDNEIDGVQLTERLLNDGHAGQALAESKEDFDDVETSLSQDINIIEDGNMTQQLKEISDTSGETGVINTSHDQLSENGRVPSTGNILQNAELKRDVCDQTNIKEDPKGKEKKRWMSFAPLKSPSFLLFMFGTILAELALMVPFSFLPDLMVHKGYEREQAVWIIFLMGK